MKFYLIRHGIAHELNHSDLIDDDARSLTKEGKLQVKEVAKSLVLLKTKPDLIISSPLIRAKQTAEIIAQVFNLETKLHIAPGLAPGHSFSDLYKDLKPLSPFDEVFLVGHEPSLSMLASHLLWTTDELNISFKKGSVCRIDIFDIPPSTAGILKWLITPKLAKCMLTDILLN